jgi:hypothetical protein
MDTNTKTPKRLTRKQINEGLDTVPISALLTGNNRELTAKQKKFAHAVALGSTGAEAYRKAYNTKALPKTQGNQAHKLKARPDIGAEIEAIKRANEAEHIKNPAALRALVINTLVELATNPDTKDAVRLQAVKVLGGVTEVAAFTERKETRVITSSEDARESIMAELRALSNADAIDVESEAADLLGELKQAQEDTHPPPTPTCTDEEPLVPMHTIPLKPDPINLDPTISDASPLRPTPPNSEDPPSSFPPK